MSSHFTVVYDACVLYPAPLRDFLMRLALTDLFRARWSDMIHDEWIRNVLAQRPDLKPEDLERTRSLMNAHVRDCLVAGFEHLIPSVELPDPDDRHVVAAAIHSGASLIVTFNLKDFPAEQLKRYNLAAQHPDDFIFDLLDLHPAQVCEAAANHRRLLKNPPKTADEYLDTLLKQGLTQTVGLLREWKVAI
ncbi:PIN domain-containing protein [Acidithiobacillus caldus]|uniref:PIN domain-containing protein n=1 Tax=Acidithiobacillus caldus TaxID=33059 RepID=UPI001C06E191|nr:PIN domain-containing protein [Acidithiobacillus caldus]MBU2763950.1 PIN domain-containing protein [Acidithiobacillus caldus]MBU2770527.1 PIN domain-containing protein [Acidithiobacillus caldus]